MRHPEGTRLLIKSLGELFNKNNVLAGEEGFEPSYRDPESRVLPLDDSPVIDITELKSSPLSGLLNTIIPLNLPQKKAGTGQLLQSPLSYH